jgi:kinesin family protein 4/21/27
MTVKETLDGATECLLYLPHSPQVVIGVPDNPQTQKSFTFDHVFNPNAEQDEVYTSCVAPLLDQFLLGFNATILAYVIITFLRMSGSNRIRKNIFYGHWI